MGKPPFLDQLVRLVQSYRYALTSVSPGNSISHNSDVDGVSADEKAPKNPTARDITVPTTAAGISFILKKKTGMTKMLNTNARLLTILDGPYPHSATPMLSVHSHIKLA
jgi:hypothetical protein